MLDAEALFDRIAAGAWQQAMDLVGDERDPLPDDAVTRAALRTLVSEVGGRLASDDLDDGAVERYVLLGRAGRLPVSREMEARAVDSLLHRYRDRPEQAVSIARFRPDLPSAIAVLSQFGPTPLAGIDTGGDDHTVTATEAAPFRAGRPLLRSPRERALYAAATRVYPEAIIQANVALHAALDFDRLKGRLTATERRYFFRALLDLVVFDPGSGGRPVRFFELDSAVHDDAARSETDRVKDRIVSAAGYRLVRIRPSGSAAHDDGEYERLLRRLESDNSIYSAGPESAKSP